MPQASVDCVVVGGGFFGASIAIALGKKGYQTQLVEAAEKLCTRASYTNQARIHGGYHYPRSVLTALRSRENYSRFCRDYAPAVKNNFKKIYAIARDSSFISPEQFVGFCDLVGCQLKPVDKKIVDYLNREMIAGIYEVEECAFDANALRQMLSKALADFNVSCRFSQKVQVVDKIAPKFKLSLASGEIIYAEKVFVATYASLNELFAHSHLPLLPLHHEWIEMALMVPPPHLNFGLTVLDGPFFSFMPFPAQSCYSLSHVSFTPHRKWNEQEAHWGVDFRQLSHSSNYQAMLHDACRFVPSLAVARYIRNMWEIKTILPRSVNDDSRPILYHRNYGGMEGLTIVLGAKIDNIYDCLAMVAEEV